MRLQHLWLLAGLFLSLAAGSVVAGDMGRVSNSDAQSSQSAPVTSRTQ